MDELRDNTKNLCGEVGSTCHRSPECTQVVFQLNSLSESRELIGPGMSEIVWSQGSDVYGAGMLLLGFIVQVPMRALAQAHMDVLFSHGLEAKGPVWRRYGRANYLGLDNALHDWVLTFIVNEPDLLKIVKTLRQVGHLPELQVRPRGEGQPAWRKAVETWKQLARLLKGLLAPSQSERWTALFARDFIQGLGKGFKKV